MGMLQFPENAQFSATLIFKHFPNELSAQDVASFLHNLGATNVKYLGQQGALKNCALADFSSLEQCWKVIRGVHQRTILEKRLCVEFFNPSNTASNEISQGVSSPQGAKLHPGPWIPAPECPSTPFAPKWDILIPVSSKLHYKYPPATENILTNIVRAMVSCPAFYTQVLHLMNRLHLPPPFDDPELFPGTLIVTSETNRPPERGPDQIAVNNIEANDELEMDLSTSTESELESDAERKSVDDTSLKVPRAIRNQRRQRRIKSMGGVLHPTAPMKASRANESRLHQPDISELFETPTAHPKLQIHVPQELLPQVAQPCVSESVGGFGLLNPSAASHEVNSAVRTEREHVLESSTFRLRKDARTRHSSCESSGDESVHSPQSPSAEQSEHTLDSFSLDELRLRRLSPEERQNYPVFTRNYSPGEPTSRLYIKNLAPSVTEHDLYRVFGVFQFGLVKDLKFKPLAPSSSNDRFSVRLLTEGRMKGQAFVGLEDELTAAQALEATNGLLLHDRPMVVQFARGAKAKVDEKSLIQPSS